MIKLFHPKDTAVMNMYAPNNGDRKHAKQRPIGLKGETGKSTIVVEDFNPLILTIDRARKGISKYIK